MERGLPSLTRQSSNPSRLKTRGLISRAELNQPQFKCISEMSLPEVHTFMISTVYVGIPFGSDSVAPWIITISDFEHLSPHMRSGFTPAFPFIFSFSFFFSINAEKLSKFKQENWFNIIVLQENVYNVKLMSRALLFEGLIVAINCFVVNIPHPSKFSPFLTVLT